MLGKTCSGVVVLEDRIFSVLLEDVPAIREASLFSNLSLG